MPAGDSSASYGFNSDLVPAKLSYQMSALGSVLHQLCNGASLFQGNLADNIIDPEMGRDKLTEKFDCVKDKEARNLITQLISTDPKLRPTD